MPKNKAKDSGTVTVRLTEEQREYLNKRKEQGHTKRDAFRRGNAA